MTTKIYVLCEPDGKIRYVGKTVKSLSQRFSRHLTEARNGQFNHRCYWIKSILSKGLLPSIFVIGEVAGDGVAEECAWIKYFRDEGIDLVNGTDGGEGVLGLVAWNKGRTGVYSADALKRMSESKKGKRQSAEHIRKLIETRKGRIPWNKGKSSGTKGIHRSMKTRKRISDSIKKHYLVLGNKSNQSSRMKEWWRIRKNLGLNKLSLELRKKLSRIHRGRWEKIKETRIIQNAG